MTVTKTCTGHIGFDFKLIYKNRFGKIPENGYSFNRIDASFWADISAGTSVGVGKLLLFVFYLYL